MTEMERNEELVKIIEGAIRTHQHWIVPDGHDQASIITSIARNAVQAMQGLVQEPACNTASVVRHLEELSNWCPGAGADGVTPVKAASLAYKNAIRVIRHNPNTCPRCQSALPQYEGHCAECSQAPDHEEG